MLLMHMLFHNNWLNLFMNHILMGFMHHVNVMFHDDVPMMLMDYVLNDLLSDYVLLSGDCRLHYSLYYFSWTLSCGSGSSGTILLD